jgi:hypothetical protein
MVDGSGGREAQIYFGLILGGELGTVGSITNRGRRLSRRRRARRERNRHGRVKQSKAGWLVEVDERKFASTVENGNVARDGAESRWSSEGSSSATR